jgi:hypothetical protein
MIPARISGATREVGKSQGYLGLPIRDDRVRDNATGLVTPCMWTAWTPTPEELRRLNAGANVEICILGNVPPPMIVEVGTEPD